MRYRKLRFAWSVVWGVVAVLLIVLWVRSYFWADSLRGPLTRQSDFVVGSIRGGLRFYRLPLDSPPANQERTVQVLRLPTNRVAPVQPIGRTMLGFRREPLLIGTGEVIVIPFWFLVLLVLLAFLSLFARQLRFRLRTLLIATTLVAVVLGSAVYVARK